MYLSPSLQNPTQTTAKPTSAVDLLVQKAVHPSVYRNLTYQVPGVRNEVSEVNSQVGRVNEKVDHVDSDVKVLKIRQEIMEQLLAEMASARPQKATKFKGGGHIHIHDGAVADQHTRKFVTTLKSARRSRSENFKGQEDSDSDSDLEPDNNM